MTSEYGSSGSFGSREGQNILGITHKQAEEVMSVQNQYQFMYQFTDQIWIIHTQEVILVGYHKQLLKSEFIVCLRELVMLQK